MGICGFDDDLLARGINHGAPLPIEGTIDVELPVEILWRHFCDVDSWGEWNGCFARAWIRGGGEVAPGADLMLMFKPIKPWLPYRLPGPVKVVEVEPERRVTWEADTLGFRARHSYTFESLGPTRTRFGSYEVAEGPAFRAAKAFWLAHFRFVSRESLAGAASLAAPA